jgi:hypothetical protein
MQRHGRNYLLAAVATIVLFASGGAFGQTTGHAPANPQFKYSAPIAPGVAVPDKIESSIGTLNLSHGYPKPDTVEKIYNNLDRSRALQAYLMAIPIVNQAGMRDSLRKFGPDNQTDVIWEDLVDARTVELTANDNTMYNFIWLDTKKGPLVVEIPPDVLGGVNDFWYRWVADMGITGEDRGKGGKYLVLPPGYKGEIPPGYVVVRPSTFGNWLFFRAFLVDGSSKPGVESVKKHLKIYQLSEAANPPAVKFINGSGVPANFRCTRRLLVLGASEQGYPGRAAGRQRSDNTWPVCLHRHRQRAAVRARPRMKKILTDAANIGAVTARTIAFKVRSKMPTSSRTAHGVCRSSAATSSRARPASRTWMATFSTTTLRPA